MIFDDILQFGLDLQWIPWELTYPLPRYFEGDVPFSLGGICYIFPWRVAANLLRQAM